MGTKKRTVPTVITSGIYDSSLIYPSSTVETNSRRVSMFELDLPLENEGVSYIDRQAIPVSRNRMIVAKPGQMRHSRLPYRCHYLHIVSSDSVYTDILSSLPDTVELTDEEEMRSLFGQIITLSVTPCPENDILLDSILLRIIGLIARDAGKLTDKKRYADEAGEKTVREAISFIDAHFPEPITLDDMASAVHLSPVYFHNLFKKAVGTTPHRYLLSVRLGHAKSLLGATSLSFAEIASRCGFSGQSYFHYVFRRELGVTPGAYRTDFSRRWDREPSSL